MLDKQPEHIRGKAFLHIIQAIATKTSKGVMYTVAALGALTLIPDVGLPAPLNTAALSLGVAMLGNLISNVASGNVIRDEKIKQDVEAAIVESGIDKLLTKEDFDCALDHLRERQTSLDGQSSEILEILNRLEQVISSTENKKPIVIRDTDINMDVEDAGRVVGVELDLGQPVLLSNDNIIVKANNADVAIGIQIGPYRGQEPLKPIRRLPVIPKPDENSRTIFKASENATSSILIRSGGEIDYVCGNCGALLVKGVREGQIRNIVFHCNQCNSYNDLH